MLLTQKNEINKFNKLLVEKIPFSLARFCDGERAILERKSITGIDGWTSYSHQTKFSDELVKSLKLANIGSGYIGISDDGDLSSKLFYTNILNKLDANQFTLSNVFVDGTYEIFLNETIGLLKKYENIYVICNESVDYVNINRLFGGANIITVGADPFAFWEQKGQAFLKRIYKEARGITGALFIFAAGPISSLTIPRVWSAYPHNTYIDIGSSLDPFFFKRATRPYHLEDSEYRRLFGQIEIQDNSVEVHRDSISVIINCYKRYDSIPQMIEAIKAQTITPREIHVLFNTNPPPALIEYLRNSNISNYVISQANLGVWNRFAYALNMQSEYVCIFDDDTIPGIGWFKNCMEQMKIKEALLGTVGILFKDKQIYLNNERFGWPSQNDKAVEVDLVGHSWFFKREWLPVFWKDLPPVEGYNFMGEDMQFSYALQKYLNIPTIVPPHPKNNMNLWGSTKPYESGSDNNAISMTGKASRINDAVRRLRSMGWRLLCENTN